MAKDKDGNTFDGTHDPSLSKHAHPHAGDDTYMLVDLSDADISGSELADQNDATRDAAPRRPDSRKMGATNRRLRQGERAGHLRNRASIDWRQDQQRVCETRGQAKRLKDGDAPSIAHLTETILFSRTAAALFDVLRPQGLSVVYDAQVPTSQYYPRALDAAGKDSPAHLITLNPNHPRGELLNMLARETRRAWQHAQGALINPLTFEPEEAILVNRAQQADVLMMSIKIAWELKLGGENEAWDYLVGSPMADVSRMFESKARDDFRTLNTGAAARAAYDQFFDGARTKSHDKRLIHQMLLDETGYIKSREERPHVTMDLFRRLGQLPNGRNYLTSADMQRPPTDPCYSTVDDRANANFLWFIKFERSFQERERKMIEDSVRLSAEVVDFANWAKQGRKVRHREDCA